MELFGRERRIAREHLMCSLVPCLSFCIFSLAQSSYCFSPFSQLVSINFNKPVLQLLLELVPCPVSI